VSAALRRSFVAGIVGLMATSGTWAISVPFGPQQIVSDITLGARAVVAGDIDGDGDLDLVSASSTDNAIGWHRNDGAGNFSIGDLLTNTFDGSRSVALGDLDGDGDLDAVGAARTLATVAWFENDGAGSFSDRQDIGTGFSGVRTVVVADVDSDGDLDVIAGGDSSSLVAWFENVDGLATFGPAQTVTTTALFVQEIYASDVDGDGDVDVLSASAIDNKFAWYANDGTGVFGPQQVLATDALDARSIGTADLDGDGDEDVIATSQDDDTVAWFENLGGGLFGSKVVISATEDEPQTVASADLDRDGDVDVLVVLQAGNALVWYENTDGEGTFAAGRNVTSAIDSGEAMTVADLDGDGDIDVVSASTDDSRIAWYENGTFRSSATYEAPFLVSGTATGVERVRVADLDGDGDRDVIAALEESGTVVWYENEGGGVFADEQFVAASFPGARDLNVADLDGDGDLDVAASAGAQSRVSWFENLDGAGTFGAERLVDTDTIGSEEVEVGDLDQDGDVDLLVASMGDDTVSWYANADGAGNFGPRRVITGTALGVRSVEAADMDGDGDLDVVYAAADANLVGLHENLGLGTFAPLQTIDALSFGPFAIDAADIDGDGDLDIASVANLGGELSWYQNGGGGVWERRLIDTGLLNPADVEAIDVDRDGDRDFVVARAGSDEVVWYENLSGIGTFGPEIVLTDQAAGAETIAGGDLDEDGDIDIAAGAMDDSAVRWLSNCGGQVAIETASSAPIRLLESGRDDILSISITHRGESGDALLNVERIRLLFEETPGVPLNEVQATELFQSFSVFRDDGSGVFERLNDALVVASFDTELVGGEVTLDLPGSVFTEVLVGSPGLFFIVTELNEDAAEKDPSSFLLSHIVEGSDATLATYLEGTPAIFECPQEVRSNEVLTGSLQLSLSGPCPGPTTVSIFGGNADDPVALISGQGVGSAAVPVGECTGAALGLDSPELFQVTNYDGNGSLVLQFDAPQGVCGVFLQALDLQNCARSNVDVVGFHAPVAEDITLSLDEDTLTGIELLATDIDEDDLTFVIVSAPSQGQLSGTPPDVNYLPNENYSGGDSFTYLANDGQLDSEVATVTLTIDPVNDAPTAFDDTVATIEDTAVAVTLMGEDVELDPLTFTLVDMPANGVLTGDAPDVTYTPDDGFFGNDTFTFLVNDGELDSEIATVTIGVSEVNGAPIAEDGSVTTDEDTAMAITLVATDPDMDPLIYSVVDDPTQGVVSGTPPLVTYTPNDDFNGSDSFTFRVNDGQLDSNLAVISITVNSINDAPVAFDQGVETDEDIDLNITLTASDVELDPLTYNLLDGPTNGTITGTAPDLTYSPNENFNGADSFTFVANDGMEDSNVATVSIDVAAVNDPPVALDQDLVVEVGFDLSVVLGADDPDGDSLGFQLVSPPANGRVSGSPPNVTYRPDLGFVGNDSFLFRATDGELVSNEATISITVELPSEPPVADDQDVTTDEDVALAITLTATDPNLDPLTYSVVDPPLNGVLTGIAPDLTYTPNQDFNGSDSFTFVANDGEADSNIATVSITVSPINDAPVAQDQAVETPREVPVLIALVAVDVEFDPLTFILVDPPSNGEVIDGTSEFTYTPDPGFVGSDSFTFIANDGDLDSNLATVSITVTAGNLAPTADDQSVSTAEDNDLAVTLTASDPELDPLDFSIVDSPANGILSGTAPDLTYTPNDDYNGADSFTFVANDGEFDSNLATVTITVDPVNDPPVADDQAQVTDEDIDLAMVLTGSDVDLDPLTYTVVDHPVSGTLTGTAPDLTYVPDPESNGADSFTFVVNDGELDSELATVNLTVNAINDDPTLEAQAVSTMVNVPVLIDLSGADIDGDSLTFSIDSDPVSGVLSGLTQIPPSAASVTYSPNLDFVGADSFVVQVDDGMGGTAIATVTIDVTP